MEQTINANNCNTYDKFANDKDAFTEFTSILEDIIHEYYSFFWRRFAISLMVLN